MHNKRNSCIAIMNDSSGKSLSALNQSTFHLDATTTTATERFKSAGSPGTSPTERISSVQRTNRMRRITNLSSIFANSSSTSSTIAASILIAQNQSRLNDALSMYSRQLPPLPVKYTLCKYEPSILDNTDIKWNSLVGETFAQVQLFFNCFF